MKKDIISRYYRRCTNLAFTVITKLDEVSIGVNVSDTYYDFSKEHGKHIGLTIHDRRKEDSLVFMKDISDYMSDKENKEIFNEFKKIIESLNEDTM